MNLYFLLYNIKECRSVQANVQPVRKFSFVDLEKS